jgi:hypothetical protein
VGVTGLLESGAAFSIHSRGGVSRGTNLFWEINGHRGRHVEDVLWPRPTCAPDLAPARTFDLRAD